MRSVFILASVVPVLVWQSFALSPQQPAPQVPAAPAAAPKPAVDEEVATFKSGVSFVKVDVQVMNGKDVVRDLAKSDFEVYDNGVAQTVSHFGREAEPLSLLLVLDVSGSMRRYLEDMASAAKEALRYLRVGDRVGIVLFSKNSKVHQEFTGDLMDVARQIQSSVWDEELGSGTNLNEAIVSAVEYMDSYQQERAGRNTGTGEATRQALLVVTDNLGLNYRLNDEKVVVKLLNANAVLNAIVVGKANRPEADRVPSGRAYNPDFTPNNVWNIAEHTGGEAVKAEHAGQTFIEMIEKIRTRYALHYKPPEARAGTFRRIRVDLAPEARKRYPKAILRYRNGYYAG